MGNVEFEEASRLANAMKEALFVWVYEGGISVDHFGDRVQWVVLLVLILLQLTCKKNPTGPEVTANVQLSVDYVTCTEVWLKLGFSDAPAGGEYRITRDGATVLSGTITGSSAVLYDTTAQAKKNYTYTAYWLSSGQVKQISPSLSVTTLDSTSHDYNWRVFYFGGAASSYLMDVSIVSDTNIWAGGAIYEFDSTGVVDPYIYNAAHWNGKSWGEVSKVTTRIPSFWPGLR